MNGEAVKFVPCADTGGMKLCSLGGTTSVSSMDKQELVPPPLLVTEKVKLADHDWPPNSEPAFLISETEARRLVTAIEDCRPSDVIAIIKRQPWWKEICAGIRATRHLKPKDYSALSGFAPSLLI